MIELSSIKEVIDTLKSLESSYYFRGYKDYNWHMIPTLGRIEENEFEVLKEYICELEKRDIKVNTIIELMECAQHEGKPTRLIDWSSNPLVALFFSISNSKHNSATYVAALDIDVNLLTETDHYDLTLDDLGDATWNDVGDFTWEELGQFSIKSSSAIGKDSSAKFLHLSAFEHIYSKFISNLSDQSYLIKRYSSRNNNPRKYLQEGLFTFHKDVCTPFDSKYLNIYKINIDDEAKSEILDILSDEYRISQLFLGL